MYVQSLNDIGLSLEIFLLASSSTHSSFNQVTAYVQLNMQHLKFEAFYFFVIYLICSSDQK